MILVRNSLVLDAVSFSRIRPIVERKDAGFKPKLCR